MRPGKAVLAVSGACLAAAVLGGVWAHTRFEQALMQAADRARLGSEVLRTRCGSIEVQQAGSGVPLLVVHGSGGGHDQGMEFARPLLARGIRVIAPSRFGCLRTLRPADASPQAQAEAHACLLDSLGLARVAVLGLSAGAPSALQLALRHPDRVSALALVVPILPREAQPPAGATAAPSDATDDALLWLLGSDAAYWTLWQLVPGLVFRYVLATPPELIRAAGADEQARVHRLAERVLPVSQRAEGLRDDTRLGKSLPPSLLQALPGLRVPTLIVSARDDGFGTHAPATLAARLIPGARHLVHERGGHLLVGQIDSTLDALARWVLTAAP